jgi:hypothetical protein
MCDAAGGGGTQGAAEGAVQSTAIVRGHRVSVDLASDQSRIGIKPRRYALQWYAILCGAARHYLTSFRL